MAEILASGMCPLVDGTFFLPEWQGIVALAFLVSASILAFLYLINRFFGNEAGEAWVKLELFELLTTVFIMVAVVSVINSACVIHVSGFLPDPPAGDEMNLFDTAAWVLEDFAGTIIKSASTLHAAYIHFDFITSTTLTQHPLGMGTVLHPTAGIGAVVKPGVINALQMLAVSFIIVRAELLILDFATFAFLKYYLPLGIILRAFAPTRRIGGTLIGISVGLVLIYPFLIFLNGVTAEGINPVSDTTWDYLSGFWDTASTPIDEFQSGALSLTEPMGALVGIKAAAGGLFLHIASIYLSVAIRISAAAFLIGLLFPALNAILLITTIRYLTRAFGEEIDISTLTRMI